MKKTIIALTLVVAIAIALSVTIPSLAAHDPDDTTIVSGTVQSAIDVVYTGSAPSFTALIPDTTDTADAGTVTVKCNKDGWSLKAKDEKTTGDIGYMITGTSTKMTNALTITGGTLSTPAALTSERTLLGPSGTTKTSGQEITNIQFQQLTDYQDTAANTYSMTVVFTGYPN